MKYCLIWSMLYNEQRGENLAFLLRLISVTTIAVLIQSCAVTQTKSNFQRVDNDLAAFDEATAKMNDGFNKPKRDPENIEWVKTRLRQMVEVDQFMRHATDIPFKNSYTAVEKDYFDKQFSSRFADVDAANTAELKTLLKVYPWFTISKFGKQADKDAWLLVQHADMDLPFQKQVLAVLEKLYMIGETDKSDYGYLFDRVAAIGEHRPQRYGTQGHCVGPSKWEPHPIEDESNLEARRKSLDMMTMAEYQKLFKNICH